MEKVLFEEEQRMRQWWIMAIPILLIGVFAYGIFQQEVMDIPFGNQPAPSWLIVLFMFIPIGLLWFFWSLKLTTKITNEMIIIDFGILGKKQIKLSDIKTAAVVTYSPLKDYGGWGLRVGTNGTAYNVAGKIGLQIDLKKGKRIMIGTQSEEILKPIIKRLFP
ncbi:MAG: hypothetical protein ACPG19_01425 [Saprospiraceae bacterium]